MKIVMTWLAVVFSFLGLIARDKILGFTMLIIAFVLAWSVMLV